MHTANIQLACRQLITAQHKSIFEKAVWDLTYREFLLKSQAYSGRSKHTSFSGLKSDDGRANSLHYKLSFPVVPLIERLNGCMPCCADVLGKPLPFAEWAIELLESDTKNRDLHAVAITYTTPLLQLQAVVHDQLIIAVPGTAPATFTVVLAPPLSVVQYEAVLPSVLSTN